MSHTYYNLGFTENSESSKTSADAKVTNIDRIWLFSITSPYHYPQLTFLSALFVACCHDVSQMLTTLISEHFVGSLSDDVFDRDLRLKEAELKNAYLEQEQ